MSTKNLVPRANGEGGIGTEQFKWGNIYAVNGNIANRNIASDGATLDSHDSAIDTLQTKVTTLEHAYAGAKAAATVADMTDQNQIYVYVGSESGYINGNWYYWNGTAWTSGGVYNATALETDKTLTISGAAADAKVTGENINVVDAELITNKKILSYNVSVNHYDDGIVFGSSSTYCYVSISNKIAYLGILSGEGNVYANNIWPIIAECENGFVILGMNGNMYYAPKDSANFVQIDNGYSISLPSYILLGNDYVKFQNYYISKDYLTTKLTNASVSDTIITMRLGMACNKSVGNAGGKIPFIFEGSYSNDGNMWYGKKGDFLGDSLTEQHQYTDALEDLYNITVNNYGKSGTTISNINSTDMFKDRISNMSLDCDFIFVLGGTNDWGLGVSLGTKTLVDNDYSTFYNALYNTLSALRNRFPLKPIFVATIPIRNWQGGGQASGIWQNSQGNSLMEFNDAICYIANIIGATVIDSFSSGINLDSLSTYTNDNLHFNEAGGKRFATYVMDCMKGITPY